MTDSKLLLHAQPTAPCRRCTANLKSWEARLQLSVARRLCEQTVDALKFASHREPGYFVNRLARDIEVDFWWTCVSCRGLDIACFFVDQLAHN